MEKGAPRIKKYGSGPGTIIKYAMEICHFIWDCCSCLQRPQPDPKASASPGRRQVRKAAPFIMNRRKAINLILLGSASITSLISYKWLDRLRATDVTYLEAKKSLLAELAETIIPQTDTPGARAVKAEEFIIRMLRDCTDARSLSNFITGLQELEAFSLKQYDSSFMACSPAQKTAIMQEFENRSVARWVLLGKIENKLIGRPFFTLLKSYTILGFCTSMGGATQALNYLGIPGSYENISPVQPDCRAWATK